MNLTEKYLNKRVRCVDACARIFFKRHGRVVQVNTPSKYSNAVTTFNVLFEHGDQVYGPFREQDLELVEEENEQIDKRPQVERLMDNLMDDMDCWVQESLVAFAVAEKDLKSSKTR